MQFHRKKISFDLLHLSIIFALALFSWGPMTKSQFGLIDDHEIIEFLGADKEYFLHDIVTYLNNFFLGYGTDRYRPTYYLLRHTETFLLQANTPFWYMSRIIMTSIAIFFISHSIYRIIETILGKRNSLIPYILSILSIFVIINFEFVNDITTRLGPGESYLFPLTAFGLYATYKSLGKNKNIWPFALLCFVFLIGMGIKENYYIFIILVTYVYIKIHRNVTVQKRITFSGIYFTTLSIFLWFLSGLINNFSETSSDIYGNSRNLSLFMTTLMENRYFYYSIFPLISLIFIFFMNFARKRVNKIGLNIYILTTTLGVLILFSETFFYQNYIYDAGFLTPRYSTLSALAFMMIFFTLIVRIQHEVQNNFKISNYISQLNKYILVLFTLLIITTSFPTILNYRNTSLSNSLNLNKEMDSVRLGVSYLEKLEGSQIHIIVNTPEHYEYLYSISTFSRFYSNEKTKIFATVQINLEDLVTEFHRQLVQEMISDSIDGSSRNRSRIDSIVLQNKNEPIVCLVMPESTLPNFCTIDIPIYLFNRSW
jgi:hypothetical protein